MWRRFDEGGVIPHSMLEPGREVAIRGRTRGEGAFFAPGGRDQSGFEVAHEILVIRSKNFDQKVRNV